VDLGFSGEVGDLRHGYRHGYPSAVIDALAGAFGLTGHDQRPLTMLSLATIPVAELN
jgi:hypothetical protein